MYFSETSQGFNQVEFVDVNDLVAVIEYDEFIGWEDEAYLIASVWRDGRHKDAHKPQPLKSVSPILPTPRVDEWMADERAMALDVKWTAWQSRTPHSRGQERYLDGVHYAGTECASFYWEEISPNAVHVHCTDVNCETHKRH